VRWYGLRAWLAGNYGGSRPGGRREDLRPVSPTTGCASAQDELEPVLLASARGYGVGNVAFDHELTGVEPGAAEVTATVRKNSTLTRPRRRPARDPRAPAPLAVRLCAAGGLRVRVIDVHGRQVLHPLHGDAEADTVVSPSHGVDRDSHFLRPRKVSVVFDSRWPGPPDRMGRG